MECSAPWTDLDELARWCVEEQAVAPAAVVACAYRRGGHWCVQQGAAGVRFGGDTKVSVSTPFDLASVTKAVFAVTLARVIRSGLLDWSMPLDVPLRESHGTASASATLELLAAHSAGLVAHVPLYEPLVQGRGIHRFEALRQAAAARRDECEGPVPGEGFFPVYSDVGYLLLGEAVARAAHQPVDELVRVHVTAPLGISFGSARQQKCRDPMFEKHVAATEEVAWRGGLVCGVVHDDNAWALGDQGMCGHAGLFGTARDVVHFGTAVLDVLGGSVVTDGQEHTWLTQSDLEPLVRRRHAGTLRAGFDGKSEAGSSAGSVCGPNTFGHLGFTGTSLWIDPDAQSVTVLLTNRVCPNRDSQTIKKVRPVVHDALFQWARDHHS